MHELTADIRELTTAVSGIDWNASGVQQCVDAILPRVRSASTEDLDAALALIVERLRQYDVEDADGTAHVAITGGTIVENGAAPEPLAEVLLEKLPSVLNAARRYADTCLADPRSPAEFPDDEDLNVVAEVDQRPILREVFTEYLSQDRPGAAALAYLEQWVMPAITCWTRSRGWLVRATNDRELATLAERMSNSSAHWLNILFGVQLEEPWLVLCPTESRGFRVLLDGITSNFDLHALLAAELVVRGIPGDANPEAVVAYLAGHGAEPDRNYVAGTWNLYEYRAVSYDLNHSDQVPTKHWVWGEGVPNDVPMLDGQRILLVGPASIRRQWSLGRMFSALPCRVSVHEELDSGTYQRELARIARREV